MIVTTRCYHNLAEALPLWQHKGEAVHGIAQSALWSQNWQQTVNSDCVVLALWLDDQPALLLPLEIVQQRRHKIARFIGGSHANCNFPVLFAGTAALIDPSHLDALISCLKQARPDIALITLTRQIANWLGYQNPLLMLRHQLNPNPVLMASLPDDFDSLLQRGNASRRRKKHRQNTRRYNEAGIWRIYPPQNRAQIHQALDAFYAMKSQRLAQQGISNSFGSADIQLFFKDLFAAPHHESQPDYQLPDYQLQVLEVAGTIRAVIGCAYWQSPQMAAEQWRGVTVEFTAFRDDALAAASPGDFLFHEAIAGAVSDGLDYFSFGTGDEKYKRDWCDLDYPLYDSHRALTLHGRLQAMRQILRSAVIYRLKTSRRLWPLVKKLRAKLGRA